MDDELKQLENSLNETVASHNQTDNSMLKTAKEQADRAKS